MKALSAQKVVKKALKKGKNDILYVCLGHIGKTHGKKIILIVDNIDSNSTKICFHKLYISAKIMQNLSSKPISEITTKMGKMYIDL